MMTVWAGLERLLIALRLSARHGVAPVCAAVPVFLLLSFSACRRGEDPPSTAIETAGRPTEAAKRASSQPAAGAAASSVSAPGRAPTPATGKTTAAGAAERWRALTQFDFAALPIGQVPTDDGNVSPIAAEGEAPTGNSADLLRQVETALPAWAPGHVSDRVQRVRNYLLILGVADYAQSPIERFLPGAVMAQMLKEFPRDELAQLVCWVALHSDEGNVSALNDPLLIELGAANLDPDEVRMRTYYYGVKLTRRIIGW